jgi:hypothetical protein
VDIIHTMNIFVDKTWLVLPSKSTPRPRLATQPFKETPTSLEHDVASDLASEEDEPMTSEDQNARRKRLLEQLSVSPLRLENSEGIAYQQPKRQRGERGERTNMDGGIYQTTKFGNDIATYNQMLPHSHRPRVIDADIVRSTILHNSTNQVYPWGIFYADGPRTRTWRREKCERVHDLTKYPVIVMEVDSLVAGDANRMVNIVVFMPGVSEHQFISSDNECYLPHATEVFRIMVHGCKELEPYPAALDDVEILLRMVEDRERRHIRNVANYVHIAGFDEKLSWTFLKNTIRGICDAFQKQRQIAERERNPKLPVWTDRRVYLNLQDAIAFADTRGSYVRFNDDVVPAHTISEREGTLHNIEILPGRRVLWFDRWAATRTLEEQAKLVAEVEHLKLVPPSVSGRPAHTSPSMRVALAAAAAEHEARERKPDLLLEDGGTERESKSEDGLHPDVRRLMQSVKSRLVRKVLRAKAPYTSRDEFEVAILGHMKVCRVAFLGLRSIISRLYDRIVHPSRLMGLHPTAVSVVGGDRASRLEAANALAAALSATLFHRRFIEDRARPTKTWNTRLVVAGAVENARTIGDRYAMVVSNIAFKSEDELAGIESYGDHQSDNNKKEVCSHYGAYHMRNSVVLFSMPFEDLDAVVVGASMHTVATTVRSINKGVVHTKARERGHIKKLGDVLVSRLKAQDVSDTSSAWLSRLVLYVGPSSIKSFDEEIRKQYQPLDEAGIVCTEGAKKELEQRYTKYLSKGNTEELARDIVEPIVELTADTEQPVHVKVDPTGALVCTDGPSGSVLCTLPKVTAAVLQPAVAASVKRGRPKEKSRMEALTDRFVEAFYGRNGFVTTKEIRAATGAEDGVVGKIVRSRFPRAKRKRPKKYGRVTSPGYFLNWD